MTLSLVADNRYQKTYRVSQSSYTSRMQNMWTTPTDYVGSVTQGFDVLRPTTFNFANGEQLLHD
jgi:hypothetical protein